MFASQYGGFVPREWKPAQISFSFPFEQIATRYCWGVNTEEGWTLISVEFWPQLDLKSTPYTQIVGERGQQKHSSLVSKQYIDIRGTQRFLHESDQLGIVVNRVSYVLFSLLH